MNKFRVTFEIKDVQAKKRYLDRYYRVVLETNDPKVMALGVLPSDQLIVAEISEAE